MLGKRSSILLAAFWLALAGGPVFGADIRMKSGQRYDGVTVLGENGSVLRISTKFGEVSLPANNIFSIDGTRFVPRSAAAPRELPQSTATPPEAPETPADTPPSVAEASSELPAGTPEPSATAVLPTPRKLAETPAAPDAPARSLRIARVYQHDWKFDRIIGGAVLAFFLWIAQLIWIQHDQYRRRSTPYFWNLIAFPLPGFGLLAYLLSPFIGKRPQFPSSKKRQLTDSALSETLSPTDSKSPPFLPAAPKLTLFTNYKNAKTRAASLNLQFIDSSGHPVTVDSANSENVAGDSSTLELARQILSTALQQRASDVHIEPQEHDYRVRLRVDGHLSELQLLASAEGLRLVGALKSLAEIDISEKRRAQDGRFRVRTEHRNVDFRLSTANSIFGEKVVIRILDRQGGIFSLDQIGMASSMEAAFDAAIHSRSGMIIVTGPTGSGKTSTLYSALSRLDLQKLNVMTIEDPVEYELAGATQIPVLPKAGVTYESGLRSILRQDPNVILVGEMRDIEAATVALRAALTGHLVFTSLHTRDSISTLVRLEELGLERTQLSSALLMLVAQRLVRVLCPACRQETVCDGTELLPLDIELPAGEKIWQAVGCPACEQTGYRGRTAIFELLIINDELRRAVAEGAPYETIYGLARANGFSGYREAGAHKILAGITSVSEVLEAT